MLKVTVSGSFHRHLHAISAAVYELTDLGVRVLSPADPRPVASHEDPQRDFLYVASDRVRSIRLVQDRHLECIRASDFLWLVAPDGYLGQSASMELGFAVASGIPIFGKTQPADLTLRQYARVVPSLRSAIDWAAGLKTTRQPGFLIDLNASVAEAHDQLARISEVVKRPQMLDHDDGAHEIYSSVSRIRQLMGAGN